MNGFGIFSLLAGGLQITIPSYGLRLVRRFGTARVGWFLVIAFLSLALMHVVRPGGADSDGFATQILYAMGSVLLLVGFGHLETLWSRDSQTRDHQNKLQRQWLLQSEERSAVLARTNQEMADEISRLEQAAQALMDSEAQFRVLFTEHPQPMWIFDLRSMRFLTVNKEALRQFGFNLQEFMNLNVPDVFAPDCAGAFLKDAARPCSRAENRGTWRQRRKDGSIFELEILGMDLKYENYPARWIIGRDTVRIVEEQVAAFEAKKLDAMACLAGGIGHHFNNALTIVDGKANLLLKNPLDPAIEQPLKEISAAANRMAGMTRQLLAVGRQHPMTREAIDVKTMFQTLYPMLRRLVGANVALRNLCGSALPPVWGDSRLIEQMLVHLVLNARRAMAGSGTLTISASNVRMEPVEVEKNENVKPGEYVRIAVRDTGCGMSPEVQSRIFEPFFTTHEIGKATGLGLASVYGAAKQQGGWVDFTSEVGVGSEFIVFLPCSARPVEHKPMQQAEPAATVRGKTILFVEPEDRSRGTACHLLKREGYRVIEADSASTVMLLWERQGPTIDLVVTDINLPGETSGSALGDQLQQAKPGLKVLYSSANQPGDPAAAGQSMVALSKPYQPDTLIKAVETCLS
jgi:PAS domain S-box-containing protein